MSMVEDQFKDYDSNNIIPADDGMPSLDTWSDSLTYNNSVSVYYIGKRIQCTATYNNKD